MSYTMQNTSHVFSNLILKTSLCYSYYYPHFTDEETEPLRLNSFPRPHHQQMLTFDIWLQGPCSDPDTVREGPFYPEPGGQNVQPLGELPSSDVSGAGGLTCGLTAQRPQPPVGEQPCRPSTHLLPGCLGLLSLRTSLLPLGGKDRPWRESGL